VAPLLTPETIPHTAVVILLDWMEPHLWLRQLCSWIQVLEEVMGHMNADEREQLEEVMASWRERGRGGASTNLDGTPSTTGTSGDGDGLLPLGPGEWSEPLGLPLCVVCQNVSGARLSCWRF
jgi:dynein light intermediate chain 1, cytosolic